MTFERTFCIRNFICFETQYKKIMNANFNIFSVVPLWQSDTYRVEFVKVDRVRVYTVLSFFVFLFHNKE